MADGTIVINLASGDDLKTFVTQVALGVITKSPGSDLSDS